jgi:mannosylglycoprotein endo-beta-mannosidase
MDNGEWKAIRAGRRGPLVSHLMFADDLLLFGEATEAQIKCVTRIMDLFCNMSGQQISHEKTSIFFSKNVSRAKRDRLVFLSRFRETSVLGKYLGVPLTGRAPKKADYNYIIEQVTAKLTAWKAKHLSFAGRVTLAKSVIEAIPIYPMMTAMIPQSCIDEIQKLQRKFIWGELDNERKYHAVNWSVVTQPREMGGLGLRRLKILNQACLSKLVWSLQTGAKDLWCEVLWGKYQRNNSGDDIVAKAADSSLWKAIVRLWPRVDEVSYWLVGDGRLIKAWDMAWFDKLRCDN